METNDKIKPGKEEPSPKQSRCSLSKGRFTWGKCIFWQGTYYKKIKHLLSVRSKDGEDNIMSVIDNGENQQLKQEARAVNGDLRSVKAKYHKGCRDSQVNKRHSGKDTKKQDDIYETCFVLLFKIRKTFLNIWEED